MILLGRNWYRWEENSILNLKAIGRNGVGKFNLATHTYKWYIFVSMLQAIRFQKRQEISRLTKELLAFQRLCSK
jgi:hypothetical protein